MTTTTSGTLDAGYVLWASTESPPAQVSGLLQDDPTFEEFRAMLRQQRAEDYRRVNKAINAMMRKGKVVGWPRVGWSQGLRHY